MATLGPEAAYPVGWKNGRVASWLVTVDHKRIGIMYIVDVDLLLRARRRARPPHARAAGDAGRAPPDEELVQRGHHDARHDDGLPRRRPDHGRLRQLPRAADDRRARHGLPAAERALVLAVPARRDRALAELVLEGRRCARRLDGRTRRCRRHAVRARATARTTGSSRSTSSRSSSIFGAINFIVTIHNMRTPGMTWMRMPLFVWAMETYAILLILAMPALSAAADAAAARPQLRHALLPPGHGGNRCSTSTCSGSSGTPRSTSWCCPPSG